MSITVTCVCGKKLVAKSNLAGKALKCPLCGHQITVPWQGHNRAAGEADATSPAEPIIPETTRNIDVANAPGAGSKNPQSSNNLLFFDIEGKHALTGESIMDFTIDAISREVAIRIAESQDIRVLRIRRHSDTATVNAWIYPRQSTDTTRSGRSRPRRSTDTTKSARLRNDSKYPSLENLSNVYWTIGVINIVVSVIGFVGGLFALNDDPGMGVVILVGSIFYGILASLTLFAASEGIRLAIDAATDLSEIRQQLAEAKQQPTK